MKRDEALAVAQGAGCSCAGCRDQATKVFEALEAAGVLKLDGRAETPVKPTPKLTDILKEFGDFFRLQGVSPPVMKVSAVDLGMIGAAIERGLAGSWFRAGCPGGVVEYDGVRFELAVRATPAEPAPPFEPGDVVALKHGGQRMTVDRLYPDSKEHIVEAVWFDGQRHLKRDRFPAACLVVAPQAGIAVKTAPEGIAPNGRVAELVRELAVYGYGIFRLPA